MARLESPEGLERLGKRVRAKLAARASDAPVVAVGMGTCGITAGAGDTMDALVEELERRGVEAWVKRVGCIGACSREPLVHVWSPAGSPPLTYGDMTPDRVSRLVEEHLVGGGIVEEWVIGRSIVGSESGSLFSEDECAAAPSRVPECRGIPPFYARQLRLNLRNCGLIDPEEIEEYVARGGYRGLAKALTQMAPQSVIDEVKRSGLREREGSGFLTGLRWEFTRRAAGRVKHLVCVADEWGHGFSVDCFLAESDPHSLLEGMAIAAYAIGADQGYVYCRSEYPLAVRRLRVAIEQARGLGLLGDGILGTDFSFDLQVREGDEAFVCGEATALMASLEGRRGEPRPRPPSPVVSGLWDRPTAIGNVKSYVSVPQILSRGAEWFNSIGTKRSSGTVVLALAGAVANEGLVEVPMGTALEEIIFEIGGGVPGGERLKAVHIGGPLGACVPASDLDLQLSFDSLRRAGVRLGSGSLIALDRATCMVEFSRYLLSFSLAESCGKCVPCRVGGARILELLDRIIAGRGTMDDLTNVEEIARGMSQASLCALGQLAPSPVLSALRHFRPEFEVHVVDGRCPAGVCPAGGATGREGEVAPSPGSVRYRGGNGLFGRPEM